MLEVVRLEGHSFGQEDAFMSRDIHLLQVLFGILMTTSKINKELDTSENKLRILIGDVLVSVAI